MATGQQYGHRSDERFLMLSSFKLLASALVLHRVDARLDSLERSIPFIGVRPGHVVAGDPKSTWNVAA